MVRRVSYEDELQSQLHVSAMDSMDRDTSSTETVFQDGGMMNTMLSLSVVVYRHLILAIDVILFFLKALGEYIRLSYRSIYPRPLRSVSGEVVMITGAGHGIGEEVAYKLSALGAIIVCVDINETTCRKTADEIQRRGGIAWAYQCDVSKKEEVQELGRRVRKDVGDVNILFNNAGIMVAKQFLQFSDQEIEDTINVNFFGQLWCLREFLPAMIKHNHGSVVFMCGLPGHAGAPNMLPYSSSKFAIRGMMESLYIELRQTYPGNRLHLMLVSPFIVGTGMVKRHRIRFPGYMGVVDVPTAAETICNALRRRAAIVFIPEIFYHVSNFVRILPAKVQLLITDFFDTGIDPTE